MKRMTHQLLSGAAGWQRMTGETPPGVEAA